MKFHNRHRTLLFVWVISILLLSSCTPAAANLDQSTATFPPPATLPVIADTATPLPATETISAPTAQTAVEVSLEQACIPIEEKIPAELTLSGVWVQWDRKPYLENLNEHTKYEVPLRGGGFLSTYRTDFAISPDAKHLAYIDSYLDSKFRTEKRILRVIKSTGHSVLMDYWPLDWQWIIGWVDNQTLALSIGNQGIIIILNPFTGHWEKFQPQWADVDYGWSSPYIPPLNWFMDDSISPYFALKDVKTENIIWQTERGGSFTWSTDGSTVAVDTCSGFIDIVSKDGQAMEFDARKLELDYRNVILSPNGQKLVFKTFSKEQLFLDFKKSKVAKLCNDKYELRWNSGPFWSPDSRFIVLGVYDTEAYPTYDDFDILIDTEQMRAYKLTTRQYQGRLAWLAEP